MKQLLIAVVGMLFLTSATPQKYFEGHIKYTKQYTDFNGKDISRKVAAYFDKEEVLYTDEKNYKILNERSQYVKLFNGNTDAYYYFNRDKTAYKIDIRNRTSQHVKIEYLPDTETIAGYECKAVKVETDLRTLVIFYSPEVIANTSIYQGYILNELGEIFKATGGALPLKNIEIDRRARFITITKAITVNHEELAARDFKFPRDVRLKPLKFGIEMH